MSESLEKLQNRILSDAKHKAEETIKEAQAKDQPIVRIGFRDVSKKNLDGVSRVLPKGGKLVIDEKPIDVLGGVVATDHEGKVVFNNTFKSRLERLDNLLLTLISSSVFGE